MANFQLTYPFYGDKDATGTPAPNPYLPILEELVKNRTILKPGTFVYALMVSEHADPDFHVHSLHSKPEGALRAREEWLERQRRFYASDTIPAFEDVGAEPPAFEKLNNAHIREMKVEP